MQLNQVDEPSSSLGRQIAVYPPNYLRIVGTILGWFLFLIAWGTLGLLWAIGVIDLPGKPLEFWTRVGISAGAAPLLAFGLWMTWDAGRAVLLRTVVYEHGFVVRGLVFPWDEIDTVHCWSVEIESVVSLDLSEFTVRRIDGTIVRFDRGVRRIDELMATIQQATLPRLLAAAKATLAAGEAVDFGDVKLTSDELRFKNLADENWKTAPWDRVVSMYGDGPRIQIRQVGQSRLARFYASGDSVSTRGVANAAVLLTLAAEQLADRGRESSAAIAIISRVGERGGLTAQARPIINQGAAEVMSFEGWFGNSRSVTRGVIVVRPEFVAFLPAEATIELRDVLFGSKEFVAARTWEVGGERQKRLAEWADGLRNSPEADIDALVAEYAESMGSMILRPGDAELIYKRGQFRRKTALRFVLGKKSLRVTKPLLDQETLAAAKRLLRGWDSS